jgi:transposase-like protein
MEERLQFVARLLDGEPMAGLCREFGISRDTFEHWPKYLRGGGNALRLRNAANRGVEEIAISVL